ncbi:MAG: GxxExxY protein [Chloroflexi bacterium]|nr:GxxExxY protein [Chloroflexota bacterium]
MEKTVQKRFAPIPVEAEVIGKKVLDAAYAVHTALGPGLLESVYEACLAHKIRQQRVDVETQVVVPVTFEGVRVETGLRLDMLASRLVIVEIKAVETMIPLYEAQLITYLKVTGLRLGYLINFNVIHLKDGIKRMVV